ncbi:MAG TPA: FlxA-like family protein [Xanthobacteraceae bacterium]|nr:FlxA-like family protein [Xanthobacteraceae bacterium]
MLKSKARGIMFIVLAASLLLAAPALAGDEAEDPPGPSSVSTLRRQIESLKRQSDDQRKQFEAQMEQQRKLIEALQQRLDQIQGQNRQMAASNQQETTQTRAQLETLQQQVKAGPSPASLSDLLENYYGEHRFVITGGAATTFSYDRERNINSYGLTFEPIFLFRPATWLLFEAEPSFDLPASGGTDVGLEYAQADIFVNDNLQITAGKFLLPFGDFIEDLHPFWINEFVSRPLPFRDTGDGGLVPFSDLGIQVRGGYQWGETGQVVDYALWTGNGPAYDNSLPTPVVGQAFMDNNIKTQSNTPSYGARVRVYPLPVSAELGDLELGASTYDGKWQDGHWFTSWGLSGFYLNGNAEMRGEYLATHRQMPLLSGSNAADNRQGWYVQAGYQLAGLSLLRRLEPYISRAKLLARYSGQNQRAYVSDEIPTAPAGDGTDVSPAQFVPHGREVALGLDYWFTPQILWKLEYDIELPESGGSIVSFGPTATPVYTPAYSSVDHAVISELAIDF